MYLEFFNEYQMQSWVKIHEIDNQFEHEKNVDLNINEKVLNFQKYFDENDPDKSYSKLKKRNAYPKEITNLEKKNLASKDKMIRMKIKKIVELFENNIFHPSVLEKCISDIEKYMKESPMLFEKYNNEMIYYIELFENLKKLKNM